MNGLTGSPVLRRVSRIVVVSAVLACLAVMLPARGAEAYIVLDEFGSTLSDPALISSTGPAHGALADLAKGELKGMVRADASGASFDGRSLVTGFEIVLRNTGAAPELADLSFLSLSFEGIYDLVTGGTGSRAASFYAEAHLSMRHVQALGGGPELYEAGLSIANYWDDAVGYHADPVALTQSNGATAILTRNDFTALSGALRMPGVILQPNDYIDLSVHIFTGVNATNGPLAQTDFFNTATLSLLLPPGAILSSDAPVPLAWVSAVPAPPAAWLFAAGLFSVACLRGYRSDPRARGAPC